MANMSELNGCHTLRVRKLCTRGRMPVGIHAMGSLEMNAYMALRSDIMLLFYPRTDKAHPEVAIQCPLPPLEETQHLAG